MNDRIAQRYHLEFEKPEVDFCECWIAEDKITSEFLSVCLVRVSRSSELVHTIVNNRVGELLRLNHEGSTSLRDFGYDSKAGYYYFVFDPFGSKWDKPGRTLDRYLLQKPSFSKSLDILHNLTAILISLHSQRIAHGYLQPHVIQVNPDGLNLELAFTGLAGLVYLLEGKTASKNLSNFEQAAQIDIESFGKIATQLFSYNLTPSDEELSEVIRTYPNSLQDLVRRIVSPEPNVSFGQIKRILQQLKRNIHETDTYYISLTNTAVDALYKERYIYRSSRGDAKAFLGDELKRGSTYAWSEASSDNTERFYHLTTSELRLFCAVEPTQRYLIVTTIHRVDPVRIEEDREKGLVIEAEIRVEDNRYIPPEANVKPLLRAIDEHVTNAKQQKEISLRDKDAISQWERVLNEQHRLLKQFQLRYHDWKTTDGGSSIIIELEQSSENDVDISEEDQLMMTHKVNGQQQFVGYYESLEGNQLKLIRGPQVNIDEFESRGVITIDNRQLGAVVDRQRKAIRKLRYHETTNPDLASILADPSQLETESPRNINMWFHHSADELDPSQKKAVRRALAAKDMFLIQGPPGTGKTSVIAELALQIIERDEHARVLITSQSNVAVNHALSKIVQLRRDIGDSVVRVGHESKADSTVELLLDHQLPRWIDKIAERSNQILGNLEAEIASLSSLTPVLDILNIAQEKTEKQAKLLDQLAETRQELEVLRAEYLHLEQALSKIVHFKQQAESVLQQVSPDDERLRELIQSFRSEYLDWATMFLQQVDKVAQISFRRSELSEEENKLQQHIGDLSREVETGIANINAHLEIECGLTFATLDEQSKFLDQHLAGRRKELDRLSRKRRLIQEWQQDLKRKPEDLISVFLQRCTVIGATCLGIAARSSISEMEFDWVIVDEAGRATHAEILVPMIRGHKIVLVGDHHQLPPTLNHEIDDIIKDISGQREVLQAMLFQELAEKINDKLRIPLTVQYRMHPAISRLVNTCFYPEIEIEDGISGSDRRHGLTWCPKPVVWYSTRELPDHRESSGSHNPMSWQNQAEIRVILQLLERIEETYRNTEKTRKTVGIITGYLAQKLELQQRVLSRAKQLERLDVEVNTVDAYQGRDRDIIIYSVVRSNPEARIGFLKDERRLNVALSRARELLIIVGDDNIRKARGDNPFRAVIDHIENHPDDCRLEVCEK